MKRQEVEKKRAPMRNYHSRKRLKQTEIEETTITSTSLTELPRDILKIIILFLENVNDLLVCQKVCKLFFDLVEGTWSILLKRKYGELSSNRELLKIPPKQLFLRLH